MQRFVVTNSSGPDYEFEGERLFVYKGPSFNTLEIFRTRAGKYVARRRTRRSMAEPVRSDATRVFDDGEALFQWLGFGDDAKRAAEALGMPLRRQLP
ncbi:hypothetical protein SAMN05421508_1296 [Caenispirillum bisanense]|uniref:Uncharacterized protein n=1 Tax=Caenispirillum bisanense TaxID=414052 RepID=A0A286H2F4_9PROT|nr:hypothetical protein SAMN05421508_1296 [Caenispirillum bisanense]